MTDKINITRLIEERLGSEGSEEMAAAMFHVLREQGAITFDPQWGFELNPGVDDSIWNRSLKIVITGVEAL